MLYSNVFICLLIEKEAITYPPVRGMGIIQNVCSCVQGEQRIVYALTLSFFMFLLAFLSDSVLFCFQKLNFTFILKRCVRQKRLFFSIEINLCCHKISCRIISSKFFLLSKLAKTPIILLKQNLKYILYFSMIFLL